MTTLQFTKLALAGAAAGALILGAGAAQAQANKCQAALKKIETKYTATVQKALAKCVNAVRKDIDSPPAYPVGSKAVGACNKNIGDAVYNGTPTPPKAVKKVLDACVAAATKSCTAEHLHLLGHLVTGVNAPASSSPLNITGPAAFIDFTCRYIMERSVNLAYQGLMAANPATQVQLAAAAAGALAGDPVDTFFKYQPSCATHACQVGGGTNVTVYTAPPSPLGTLPLTVTGSLLVDVCAPTGYALTPGENLIIAGAQSKGITPTNLIIANVCTTQLTAVGYCDCGSNNAPGYNYTLCRDSDTTGGGSCTQTIVLSDDPGTTNNGPLVVAFTGTSVDGGCAGTIATAFKTVTAAQYVDGVACNQDDTAAILPATAIPFTTGTSSATIKDRNNATGSDLANSPVGGAPSPFGPPPENVCSKLRASVLTGMKFGGSAIALDGGATNDAIIELQLQCN